jgi:hypothetical protein
MKKYWDVILFVVCTVVLIWLLVSDVAHGHGWYDLDCCHDNDCAPVLSMEKSEQGDILTSKYGSVLISPDFDPKRRRQSKDDQYHVCMRPVTIGSTLMIPLCVYYPPLY